MIKTTYIVSKKINKWWYYYWAPNTTGIKGSHYRTGHLFERRIMVIRGSFYGEKKVLTHENELTYWETFRELADYWNKKQHEWHVDTYREYKSYPVGLMVLLLRARVDEKGVRMEE